MSDDPASPRLLPADLELRISALESSHGCGEDFDVSSLIWLSLLGVVIPVALLLIGWCT
jgi:hypothetical protein